MTPPPAARRRWPGRWGVARPQRADFWAGARAIWPLMPGSAMFGLAFGALVQVAGINPWVGNFASVSVVAGASQIAAVEQLRQGAPALIAIATALVINARFALYSAALAPVFAPLPKRWRFGLAHVMTDQSAVVTMHHADQWPDPVRRRWFILGVSVPFVAVWVMGTAAGIALGPVIPDAWQIGFIVPLMFIAVMVPGLRDAPSLVAALAAVTVVVVARGLPFGLNVLVGAAAGIVIGSLVPDRHVHTLEEDLE